MQSSPACELEGRAGSPSSLSCLHFIDRKCSFYVRVLQLFSSQLLLRILAFAFLVSLSCSNDAAAAAAFLPGMKVESRRAAAASSSDRSTALAGDR